MQIICLEREDEITHLVLVGRLDMLGLQQVETKFHGYTTARGKSAIVDLSQVEMIASLGLGMLISCSKALGRAGRSMVLLNPQPVVDLVLRTAKIDAIIPIVATMEAAVAMATPSSTSPD